MSSAKWRPFCLGLNVSVEWFPFVDGLMWPVGGDTISKDNAVYSCPTLITGARFTYGWDTNDHNWKHLFLQPNQIPF